MSILDVSYLYFPKLFKKKDLYQLKFWGRFSIGKASKIITISKSSKNDIIKAYNVSEKKVAVVYPGTKQISGIKYNALSMSDLSKKFCIKGDYILFVGTLQPRKNVERLIEAFAKLVSSNKYKVEGVNDLSLVIVGKKGWM